MILPQWFLCALIILIGVMPASAQSIQPSKASSCTILEMNKVRPPLRMVKDNAECEFNLEDSRGHRLFESGTTTMQATQLAFVVSSSDRYGLLSKTGELVLPLCYDRILPVEDISHHSGMHQAFIVVQGEFEYLYSMETRTFSPLPIHHLMSCNARHGLLAYGIDQRNAVVIDLSTMKQVIKPVSTTELYLDWYPLITVRKENTKTHLYHASGTFLGAYSQLINVRNGRFIAGNEDGKIGVIDTNASWLVPAEYDRYYTFIHGVVVLFREDDALVLSPLFPPTPLPGVRMCSGNMALLENDSGYDLMRYPDELLATDLDTAFAWPIGTEPYWMYESECYVVRDGSVFEIDLRAVKPELIPIDQPGIFGPEGYEGSYRHGYIGTDGKLLLPYGLRFDERDQHTLVYDRTGMLTGVLVNHHLVPGSAGWKDFQPLAGIGNGQPGYLIADAEDRYALYDTNMVKHADLDADVMAFTDEEFWVKTVPIDSEAMDWCMDEALLGGWQRLHPPGLEHNRYAEPLPFHKPGGFVLDGEDGRHHFFSGEDTLLSSDEALFAMGAELAVIGKRYDPEEDALTEQTLWNSNGTIAKFHRLWKLESGPLLCMTVTEKDTVFALRDITLKAFWEEKTTTEVIFDSDLFTWAFPLNENDAGLYGTWNAGIALNAPLDDVPRWIHNRMALSVLLDYSPATPVRHSLDGYNARPLELQSEVRHRHRSCYYTRHSSSDATLIFYTPGFMQMELASESWYPPPGVDIFPDVDQQFFRKTQEEVLPIYLEDLLLPNQRQALHALLLNQYLADDTPYEICANPDGLMEEMLTQFHISQEGFTFFSYYEYDYESREVGLMVSGEEMKQLLQPWILKELGW